MIPYAQIDTVFLDKGNTLVSIDFERLAREASACGFACEAGALRRAEAAIRPAFSRWLAEERSTEGADAFAFYLAAMLGRLEGADRAGAEHLAGELVARLRRPGHNDRLWREVLPGVPEALAALRGLGLRLLVVSNSDGSVERGLRALGLAPFFDAVVDSAVVGFEKPDPRIFRHALAVAGAEPARTLHVGDLFHADVTGARAAGVHAVLLDPYGDWEDSQESACERLPDLAAVAERLAAARGAS